MILKETPSQTAGPFVHIGCLPTSVGFDKLAPNWQLGQRMVKNPNLESLLLELIIFDGSGAPLKDAMVELWQAGPDGGFGNMAGFSNWGRQASDFTTGLVRFETLKPAALEKQAPHILVWIVARGINLALTTRVYFPDEKNDHDAIFTSAGKRAPTLIAQKTATGYAHSIYLQGPHETVFFDV